MLKRTQYFSVPGEVPISPAWMPITCELLVKVKREAFAILQGWWVSATVVRRFREEAAGSG